MKGTKVMMRKSLAFVVVGALACAGCGSDTPSNPVAPATVSSVNMAGGTVYIGETAQFSATSVLSNGQTAVGTGTWASSDPSVATVDQNGLVTGVSAGETTISVEVNPRAEKLVRVYPNFAGDWAGIMVLTTCEATGAFVSLVDVCAGFSIGSQWNHIATHTQSLSSVQSLIDLGDGVTTNTSGTISANGELQLQNATVVVDPINNEFKNMRFRSDVSSKMTGTMDLTMTATNIPDTTAQISYSMQSVVRTAGTGTGFSNFSGGSSQLLDEIRRILQQAR